MAAHCGLACCIYLLVLASIVASQEDNSYKYTIEVKEDSIAAQLNSKEICDQVPTGILECSRKQGLLVSPYYCVTYNDTERLFQVALMLLRDI